MWLYIYFYANSPSARILMLLLFEALSFLHHSQVSPASAMLKSKKEVNITHYIYYKETSD